MTTSTEFAKAFDRALKLRDDEPRAAISILEELIPKLDAEHLRLKVHSLTQLAFLHFELGEFHASEQRYRAAIGLAPRFELGSLGLVHSLLRQHRLADAMREVLRFVSLRGSTEYRELLTDEFLASLEPDAKELGEVARERLDRWC